MGDGLSLAQLLPSANVAVVGCGGLTRLKVTANTAVLTRVGLIRPATVGTPTAGGTIAPLNISNRSIALGQVSPVRFIEAWTVAPTFAASPLYSHIAVLPATIGASFTWEWPEDDPYQFGLQQASLSSSLLGAVLRNITGGASADLYIEARFKIFPNANGLNN